MKLALVHGWAMHSGIWGPLLPMLEQQAQCRLLELPGHGREPMMEGEYSLATLAEHVAVCIDKGSVLLGWSLGAMVATQVALSYPDKVRALVLLAATPRFVNQEGGWQRGVTTGVLQGFASQLDSGVEKTLARFLSLQLGNNSSAEQLRELRQLVKSRPVPTAGVLRSGLQILATADLRDQVGGLNLPVLLVHGDRDRLMPVAAAHWLHEQIPGSELALVSKAGHAPFLSHTPEVVSEIAAFLQRLDEDNQ